MKSAIDFSKYDIVHCGVSGGKDSQACLRWVNAKQREARVNAVVHQVAAEFIRSGI